MIGVLIALVLIPIAVFMIVLGVLLVAFHPITGFFVLLAVFGALYWLWRRGTLRTTRPVQNSRVSRRF